MELNLTPTATEMSPSRRGRAAADTGPNPFIVNGWLKQSFDQGKAYSVTVPGTWEDVTKKNREGVDVTRNMLRGDAATVVKLIRAASNELNIGVAIETATGRRKGTIEVKYLGQKRKEARKPKTDTV